MPPDASLYVPVSHAVHMPPLLPVYPALHVQSPLASLPALHTRSQMQTHTCVRKSLYEYMTKVCVHMGGLDIGLSATLADTPILVNTQFVLCWPMLIGAALMLCCGRARG